MIFSLEIKSDMFDQRFARPVNFLSDQSTPSFGKMSWYLFLQCSYGGKACTVKIIVKNSTEYAIGTIYTFRSGYLDYRENFSKIISGSPQALPSTGLSRFITARIISVKIRLPALTRTLNGKAFVWPVNLFFDQSTCPVFRFNIRPGLILTKRPTKYAYQTFLRDNIRHNIEFSTFCKKGLFSDFYIQKSATFWGKFWGWTPAHEIWPQIK